MPAFFARFRRAALTGTCALLALAPLPRPAPAQTPDLSPKGAWTLLGRLAAEQRGSLSARSARTEGDSIVFADVELVFERDLRVNAPELRLTRAGAEALQVALPQPFEARLRDSPTETFVARVTADGSLTLRHALQAAGLALDFARLSAEVTREDQRPRPESLALSLSLRDLRGTTDLGLVAPHDATLSLSMGPASYTLDYAFPSRPEVLVSRGGLTGLTMTASTARFPGPQSRATLRQAFAAGFRADADLTLLGAQFTLDHTRRGRATRADGSLGTIAAQLGLAEGRVSMQGRAAEARGEIASRELTGGAEVLEAAVRLALPLLASAEPAELTYSQHVDGLTLSPEALERLGAQSFAGESASARTELTMQAVVTRDLDLDEFDDRPPFDLRAIVGTLGATLGRAVLSADFDLTPAPGAWERIGDGPPEVTGRITADLRGGQALIRRLTEAGILQGEQAFMAAGVLGALGRAVGEDHLMSDIELRPGGQVLVNGAPAPF